MKTFTRATARSLAPALLPLCAATVATAQDPAEVDPEHYAAETPAKLPRRKSTR